MEREPIQSEDATPAEDEDVPQAPGGDTDHVVEEKGEDDAA